MSDIDPLARTAVAPDGTPPLLAETFDADRVTEIRHAVAARSEATGLQGARLDDFVLAVNELMTNAVRHGGGQGWLRLWSTGGTLYCLVSDTGAGIGAERLDDRRRPLPEIAGGWGLWLARQLSDEMLVDSGPAGTTVRISAHLDAAGSERPTG
ncbi:ATP-binding protein [Plantactinospora sp. BB1]|uniref:ATP-binding protein n=1 Tax=Plantactinospora sp. BB1 TaxID=2071627 RepID=UPI000D15B655|nr:ATP-binding protein [Plantactinospora sp. BB1]AVT36850.1 ATPase [Plantactinospora sp. BB1]